MKKATLFIQLGLLVCSSPLVAQNVEPVIASVTYQFIHVNDTNNRLNPVRADMILRLGQTNSQYSNASLENQIREAQKKAKESIPAGPIRSVAGKPLAVVSSQNMSNDVFFQIPREKKLVRNARLAIQDYVIETPLPKIDWKIENEVRTIGNYSCQKAIGSYAGRVYTAWFTVELPFPYGPWKLWGLPGLILEARDSKNEVRFLFKEISKETGEDRIMSEARRPVKISEETFARAKKNFEDDPAGVVQAKLPAGSPPVPTYYTDSSGRSLSGDEAKAAIKRETKKQNNNPIELIKN